MNSSTAKLREDFLEACNPRLRDAATDAIDKLVEFSEAQNTIELRNVPDDHNTSICYVVKERGCLLWKAYAEQEKVEFLIRWPETLTSAESRQFRDLWKSIRRIDLQESGKGSVAALPFHAFQNKVVWMNVLVLLEWGSQLPAKVES